MDSMKTGKVRFMPTRILKVKGKVEKYTNTRYASPGKISQKGHLP